MKVKGVLPPLKRNLIILASLMAVLIFPVMSSARINKNNYARHRIFSRQEINTMKHTEAEIITKFGTIVVRFFPDVAPNHVHNFIKLAEEGFYNGTTFHRVIPGFMIQGGDPATKPGANQNVHGPGYTLKEEFNSKPHLRGTLSMARTPDPNSAGSQFFICVAPAPFLNGQYTVFGEVVSGMDVADKIVSQPRDRADNPLERVEMQVRIIKDKD